MIYTSRSVNRRGITGESARSVRVKGIVDAEAYTRGSGRVNFIMYFGSTVSDGSDLCSPSLSVEGDNGDISIVFHLILVLSASSTGELGGEGFLSIEGAGGVDRGR